MEPLDVRRRDYIRQRDARVALIRCADCNEYYEASVRQARRIRKGEARRLCHMCRTLEAARECTPDQTQAYMRWWLEESGIPHSKLLAIATSWAAVAAAMCQEEEQDGTKVRMPAPATSPSRRLPREEGNRSNGGDGSHARVRVLGNSQAISTHAA